jgi:hypothetical protein
MQGRNDRSGVLACSTAEFARIDFDGFENTGSIEGDSGFVAMGFDHEEEGTSEIFSTFFEGVSVGHCAGDFLDPTDEHAGRFRLDDGVICLSHGIMKPI